MEANFSAIKADSFPVEKSFLLQWNDFIEQKNDLSKGNNNSFMEKNDSIAEKNRSSKENNFFFDGKKRGIALY